MKVESLSVERRPSYDNDYPNMLVGLVRLVGHTGSTEVRLSNAALASIFATIKSDVQRVASYNASQAGQAIDDASNEQKLIDTIDGDVEV